ncbi:MAG: hypothetical protein WD398_04885 [Cyclobacteriaceae bacterium]
MKKLMFLFLLLFSLGDAFGQSVENKGKKIPVVEKVKPSRTQKGISISSAARRRSLVNKKMGKTVEESSDKSKANPGSETSGKARSNMPAGSRKPSGIGRPSITVPAARPTPPVVRPYAPRPNTTPAPKGKPKLPVKPGGI